MGLRPLRRIFIRLLVFFYFLSILLVFLYVVGSLQEFTAQSIFFIMSMCGVAGFGCMICGVGTAVMAVFVTHEFRYFVTGGLAAGWGAGVFFLVNFINQLSRTA
jgi:hypothetical protein